MSIGSSSENPSKLGFEGRWSIGRSIPPAVQQYISVCLHREAGQSFLVLQSQGQRKQYWISDPTWMCHRQVAEASGALILTWQVIRSMMGRLDSAGTWETTSSVVVEKARVWRSY